MAVRSSAMWAGLVVVGLIVGVLGGYFARAGEMGSLQQGLASAQESKGMLQAELDQAKLNLATATESKGMLEEELQALAESKAMLQEELKALTAPIALTPEAGQMIHDVWLFIAPVEGGKFAVVIRAEGLEAAAGEGIYLVEGVERAEPMQTVPLGPSLEASKFAADGGGQVLYWVVLDEHPRQTFEKVLILFLPGMSMERAVLLATANLG